MSWRTVTYELPHSFDYCHRLPDLSSWPVDSWHQWSNCFAPNGCDRLRAVFSFHCGRNIIGSRLTECNPHSLFPAGGSRAENNNDGARRKEPVGTRNNGYRYGTWLFRSAHRNLDPPATSCPPLVTNIRRQRHQDVSCVDAGILRF